MVNMAEDTLRQTADKFGVRAGPTGWHQGDVIRHAAETTRDAAVGASGGRWCIRIAADIGKTFTDITVLGADARLTTKKPSLTPGDHADGVVKGIVALPARQIRATEKPA